MGGIRCPRLVWRDYHVQEIDLIIFIWMWIEDVLSVSMICSLSVPVVNVRVKLSALCFDATTFEWSQCFCIFTTSFFVCFYALCLLDVMVKVIAPTCFDHGIK